MKISKILASALVVTCALSLAACAKLQSVSIQNPGELEVGDSALLTTTYNFEEEQPSSEEMSKIVKKLAISYTTADDKVASVDGATLTAVAAGTTKITVTSEDGKYTDTIDVTVKAATPLTVKCDKEGLKAGDTAALTLDGLKEADKAAVVTWTSSDEKVATVDKDGNLTAMADGSVTITVTLSTGRSAELKLTIAAAEPEATPEPSATAAPDAAKGSASSKTTSPSKTPTGGSAGTTGSSSRSSNTGTNQSTTNTPAVPEAPAVPAAPAAPAATEAPAATAAPAPDPTAAPGNDGVIIAPPSDQVEIVDPNAGQAEGTVS